MRRIILSTRSITNKFFLPALVAALFLSSASLFASDDPKRGKETLDIIDKVVDHHYIDLYFLGKVPLPHFEPVEIFGVKFDFSITKSTAMVFLASIIAILILAYAASSNKKNKIPKGIGNMIEAVIVFIRDEIVVANMGKDGLKYMPFFLTMFFFVLFANLIGLFPFLAQPTKNINITAALALITFFMTQAAGIKAHGFGGYVKNLVGMGKSNGK